MKMKGMKLTGSSILTVLGVVCFATILVAAAVLLGSATWTNNASAGATVTKTDAALHDGNALTTNTIIDNQYTFSITVAGQTTATGQLNIEVAKTGIEAGNVGLAWWDASLNENAGGWVLLTPVDGGDVLTYSYPVTTDLTPTSSIVYEFQIEYNLAGTYVVTANVNLV